MLELPLRWKKPQTIFVNSMSDLFHEDVPLEYIQRVFDVMRRAHWHRFQVLTKRAERLAELDAAARLGAERLDGRERRERRLRVPHRRSAHAPVRSVQFLSLEPLLGPLPELDLRGIDWVIVGGESGPGARPMDPSWVDRHPRPVPARRRAVLLQAVGRNEKEEAGRVLDGRTWDEYPLIKPPSASKAKSKDLEAAFS